MKWLYYLLAAICWIGVGYILLTTWQLRPGHSLKDMVGVPVEPYEVWGLFLALILTQAARAAQGAAQDVARVAREENVIQV